MFYFFFFQAEDGIRDAQESRGLGDVYKRQVSSDATKRARTISGRPGKATEVDTSTIGLIAGAAVSYTHLTLPTIYSV